MNHNSATVFSVLVFIAIVALESFCLALDPQTCTITNLRDEVEAQVSSVEFFQGQSLHFTNCVAFAGSTTNSTRQDLSGLTLTLTMGINTNTTCIYTGAAMVATSGTWSARISSVPTNWTEAYLQFKITDGTNSYVYPWKLIKTKGGL